MVVNIAEYSLQYGNYLLELLVLASLVRHGAWRSRAALCLYVFFFLSVDALARPYVLYRFGESSLQYSYFYWLTDALLALGAFLLVCAFFRRASSGRGELWEFLRTVLPIVFILVLGISLFSIARNYDHLFTRFIVEFQQNLYFTCLVLNTLLYLLIQHLRSHDEELNLLVCGLGVQFAGPAANFALMYLTPGGHSAGRLLTYVSPLCTLGMFSTWFYAVARAPKAVPGSVPDGPVANVAGALARQTSGI